MKTTLVAIVLMFLACSSAGANELAYRGNWNTTNRKLDGVMTCAVSQLARHELKIRFQGTWQGAAFDYTVTFAGPANDLHGTATIDGAAYKCRGSINRERFKANFNGDRYAGSFDLQRTEPVQTARK